MSGCGDSCNGPCSTRSEGPRDKYTLTDALAKVIIDNKVIRRTVELYELGVINVDDLIAQITADKVLGQL